VSHDTSGLAVVIARLLADRAARRRADAIPAPLAAPPAQPDRTALAVAVAKALVLTALLFTACAPPKDADCDALKSDLEHCLGSPLARLDCSTVTDVDVRKLRGLVESTSCDVLAAALPIDGDLQSTTCKALGVGCVAPVSPPPEHLPAQYPLVLVNGIDTSPFFRYSDRIVSTLSGASGQRVYLATLSPWQTPQHRAPELWARVQQVLQDSGAAKVNLVCHSLGGLDCRYLVSPNGLSADLDVQGIDGTVASITTVGTAHRGTRVADQLLGLIPGSAQAIDDFASIAGDWFSATALQQNANVREALHALTTVEARSFNDSVVDAPGVYYQSFAGISRPLGQSNAAIEARALELCMPDEASDAVASSGAPDEMALALVPFDRTVSKDGDALLPHDGFVTVDSARWGNFRGCLPADHMEQLGQYDLPDVNVKTGVDIARFYAALAADLARRGF
jgi:triacylglycerol lipase